MKKKETEAEIQSCKNYYIQQRVRYKATATERLTNKDKRKSRKDFFLNCRKKDTLTRGNKMLKRHKKL